MKVLLSAFSVLPNLSRKLEIQLYQEKLSKQSALKDNKRNLLIQKARDEYDKARAELFENNEATEENQERLNQEFNMKLRNLNKKVQS